MPRPWVLNLAAGVVVAAVALFAIGTLPGPRLALAADPCEPSRPRAAGDFTETLTAGGFDREYILHIPPSYDGGMAVPLVLNFHGIGSDAEEQMDYSELPAKADEEGFILVAPQGTVTEFIPSRHWNFTTLEVFDDTPDDVAFVSVLLDALEAELCVDTTRIFAAGMSNGAQMSVRLACNLSERIAAVAPVAGSYFPPAFTQLTGEPGCDSTRPVPLLAFHGTDDPIIKFAGGPLGLAIPFDTRHIEDAAVPEWAEHNGCRATPEHETVTAHVRVVRYTDCDADVALYVVQGGHHEWPGASDGPGSQAGDEISATDLMWDFFQSHVSAAAAPATPAQQSGAPAALPDTGTSDGVDRTWLVVAGAGVALCAVAAACGLLVHRNGPSGP